MKIKVLFLLLFINAYSYSMSQVSGNEAYNQGYSYSSDKSQNYVKLYINDSSFIIQANVLYNAIADNYVAVFGLSQESTTLEDCNNKIDKRISSFRVSLQKLGINPENVYTDMTTQNKIYDFKMNGNLAEEYLQGFEIKKNVIVRFKDIKDLEEMSIRATDFQIYDLVKVDYMVDDINKVYNLLFQSAIEVINQKKNLYIGATNMKLLPSSQIYSENFYSFCPNQLYKSYMAYETGDVDAPYKSNYTVKEIRKSKTFYYNKIDYSGFNKVINPSVTEPAIEYVLVLAIKYQIEKQKK